MLSKNIKKIYLIGIKGTGMSSLAVLLKKLGYQVSGSDTAEKFFTETQLKNSKIPYTEGFSAGHIKKAKPDLVITSTAYNERNPEIAEAKILRSRMMSYPEAVGAISRQLISIAVCGSHGKTTTTSMLGWIMQSNGATSVLTGTVADDITKNNHGKPSFFVFEADEYQNKLQHYSPAAVILTNIDYDHPDYFKNKTSYLAVFKEFTEKILKQGGFVLYCAEDKLTSKLLRGKPNTHSYGFSKRADYRIELGKKKDFTIRQNGDHLADIKLSVFGNHNILNATAAAVMAMRFGIPPDATAGRLASFKGVKRRMELVPSKKYTIIDDYGHHPTEIRATLSAIREQNPKAHITAVFHPHTFTRTKALIKDFGKAFKDANLTLVLDIYPSARETASGIHSEDVVRELAKNKAKAVYTPSIPDAAAYIKHHIPKGSIVVTIGAGNVWQLCELIK